MFQLFKSFICFLLLTTTSIVNATPLIIEPILVRFSEPTIVKPPAFVPIERKTKYSLKIDAEKSYFYIEKNPSSYVKFGSGLKFDFPDAPEIFKYSVSGSASILDIYFETGGYLQETVKVSSIDIESEFNKINLLASDGFWNEDYMLKNHFVNKSPSNMICACSTLVSIDFSGPRHGAVFDGQKLEYTGEGLFMKDDASDMFLLESSFDATHKISYYIEANVVSSVPIPAAFYLFFSGGLGLLLSRGHRNS